MGGLRRCFPHCEDFIISKENKTDIPAGFRPIRAGGPFIDLNGPLYAHRDADALVLGLRVDRRHVNPAGNMHGGMMASFCDMLLPMAAHAPGSAALKSRFLLTVNLQIDYLAGAPLGTWLEGRAEVLRTTRTMVFARGLVTADGQPCARASGVFKIGPVMNREMGDAFEPGSGAASS